MTFVYSFIAIFCLSFICGTEKIANKNHFSTLTIAELDISSVLIGLNSVICFINSSQYLKHKIGIEFNN